MRAVWQELGLSGNQARGLPKRLVLAVIVPQLMFYLMLRHAPLTAALLVAGGWSAGLQLYDLVRRRALDPFLLYGFVFAVVQSVTALVARSPAIYVGGGVAENLLVGLAFLGSVAISRPLLVEVMGSSIGGQAEAALTPPVRGALGRLTGLWALGFLARSTGLYVALTHLTIGQFLIVNALVGWPLNGVGVLLSLAYLRAQIRQDPSGNLAAVRLTAQHCDA